LTEKTEGNPFESAASMPKKIKLLVWGATGTGKTTLALQFPAPVVIDMEGGCDLYGDRAKFDVLRTSDLARIRTALQYLSTQQHNYQTLVIDPITVYWEETQRYWQRVFLDRMKGAKGHKTEFFELGPKEWAKIKESYKTFMQRLIDLPMHVVCCARSKVRYKDGGYMVADGEAPDCEKSTEYLFDVVLQLTTGKNGSYEAVVIKDRTGSLPALSQTNEICKLLLAERKPTERKK
jgi:hypothetical protein